MNNSNMKLIKEYNNYIIKHCDIDSSKLDTLYEEFVRSNKSSTTNGTIKRPRGRKPKGKIWNEITGQWDDESKELILNNSENKNIYDGYKLSDLKKESKKRYIRR